MLIKDKIKEEYHTQNLNRAKRLEEIKAPQVVIDFHYKQAESMLDGTFKLPGEVRGHHKPYLDSEFTTGYCKVVDKKLHFWFPLQKVDKKTFLYEFNYLRLSRDRWDGIDFHVISQPKPINFDSSYTKL